MGLSTFDKQLFPFSKIILLSLGGEPTFSSIGGNFVLIFDYSLTIGGTNEFKKI